MYINGLKYACSTCIKGHRSSHCSHVDRPLFEIRKKGRPVTQCTFCRDLRKTKQVHIKCACTDKKAVDSTNSNPLLIYRNNSSCSPKTLNATTATSTTSPVANDIMTVDVCQDKKAAASDCTCPSTNVAGTTITTNTTNTTTAAAAAAASSTTSNPATFVSNVPMVKSSSSNLGFNQYQQCSSSANQHEGHLAPLCPKVPVMKEEENLSYSWALITSPPSNQMDFATSSNGAASLISSATTTTAALESNQLFTDMMMDTGDDLDTNHNTHLGFIFHKPTSQRFLDGQPRVRRRRSTKQPSARPANRLPANALIDTSNLAINTITDYSLSTPPSSAVSPHPLSSSNSSLVVTSCEPMDMHFDYLTEQLEILSNGNSNSNSNGNGNGTQFMGDLANAEELTAILNNVFKEDEIDSVSSTSQRSSISATAAPAMAHAVPTTMRSQCGSFVPRPTCCKPASNSVQGESVVITITPLSTNNNATDKRPLQENYPTTTRIVTCYCGNQCTCPGCLVHPGNFFLGSDPYAGPLVASSNSSSCYGSDEEDVSATVTTSAFNNYNLPFS